MKTNNQKPVGFTSPVIALKRSGAILLSAVFLMGVASCDKDDDDPILDTINQQDRNFAISSSQFINGQIAFTLLVLDKGQDDSVLEYGDLILQQNLATKSELTGILNSKNVAMSDGISTEMQLKYDELASLEGEAFDEAFIDYQISELDKAKSMFENEADNGENFTIKGFAAKTLDDIKSNRNKAVIVRAEIDIENI